MTKLSVHVALLDGRAAAPRLISSALVMTGVMVAALMGTAASPELPRIDASAPQPAHVATSAAPQSFFAFGFIEFDWDPNALGGVPGFDSWSSRELRFSEARARN